MSKYEKILHDDRVLFALKGLYIFCMEHRKDTHFTIKHIENASPHSECTIGKHLIELEKLGYIRRSRVKANTPNFMDSQWYFMEFDK